MVVAAPLANLRDLIEQLRCSLGIQHKQEIQLAGQYLHSYLEPAAGSIAYFPSSSGTQATSEPIRLGDDCAAIWQGDRYLLLAAEGMLPDLVEQEPWFAGWCAVMVNISDIAAMGGRAIAVVDTLWTSSSPQGEALWAGMQAAASAYGVPIVGGHTNCHSPYTALSVAILGETRHLITSFNARPGDILLMAIDLRGKCFKHHPCWNAATETNPQRLREDLALLPHLAAQGWCDAGKDISMGGILGTALMLLETSGCGANIDLAAIPKPKLLGLKQWLQQFPSYGFLFSVRPEQVASMQSLFQGRDLCCQAIGTVNGSHKLTLTLGQETETFWNLAQQPLTGWANSTELINTQLSA